MGDAPQILEVLKAAALAGDMQAINIVMQRIMPPIKARADRVAFELDPEASLTNQARQILSAIAAGEVDPDTGKGLLDCLSAVHGIAQVDELAERLKALEERLAS